MTRFTDRFGCRYPLQMAGMGGMATPALAEAVSAAGAFGMVSGVGQDDFSSSAGLGVNFLIPFLDVAALDNAALDNAALDNAALENAALDKAAAHAPLVEFFWGDADPSLVARAQAHGAACGWQVGSADEARGALDAGVDVIVAQGVGAGGHVRGTTPWRALLDELRPLVDGILVIGGGIGTAEDVAAKVPPTWSLNSPVGSEPTNFDVHAPKMVGSRPLWAVAQSS